MPEETKNAAVSGEWKLVPVAQLKKWHRDLDACQKVMWLRGGFDPAYCMDAQDCLKEMEGVLAASVPPAGGEVEVLVQARSVGDRIPSAWADIRDSVELEQMQRTNALCEARDTQNCYEFRELVDRYHVTRLQAENAALHQRLNVADQQNDELQSELTKARELLAAQEKVIELAKVIDKQAFAKGTQNVGVVAFRAMGDALVELAHQSAPASPQTNTSGKAHCPHCGICHGSDETCVEAKARIDSLSAPAAKGAPLHSDVNDIPALKNEWVKP